MMKKLVNEEEYEVLTDVKDIIELSKQRSSVYVTVWGRKSPAAFIAGWPLRLVLIWIEHKRFLKKITK